MPNIRNLHESEVGSQFLPSNNLEAQEDEETTRHYKEADFERSIISKTTELQALGAVGVPDEETIMQADFGRVGNGHLADGREWVLTKKRKKDNKDVELLLEYVDKPVVQ